MKKNATELIIIIDKSGSMSGLESDVVGGYNTLLEGQKKNEGETKVTTIFFDDKTKKIVNREDLSSIKKMESTDYQPSGCTALLDAVGGAITELKATYANIKEEALPEHVIFSIMTDGYENSSKEYTYKTVKKLIKEQTDEGWEFLFQAANIDAAEEGDKIGIVRDACIQFESSSDGVRKCFMKCCNRVDAIRQPKAKIK